MLSKTAQRQYEQMLTEIVSRVRLKSFTNVMDIADSYERSRNFGSTIKRVVIERGLITAEEWNAGFQQKGLKRVSWKCGNCGVIGKRERVLSV